MGQTLEARTPFVTAPLADWERATQRITEPPVKPNIVTSLLSREQINDGLWLAYYLEQRRIHPSAPTLASDRTQQYLEAKRTISESLPIENSNPVLVNILSFTAVALNTMPHSNEEAQLLLTKADEILRSVKGQAKSQMDSVRSLAHIWIGTDHPRPVKTWGLHEHLKASIEQSKRLLAGQYKDLKDYAQRWLDEGQPQHARLIANCIPDETEQNKLLAKTDIPTKTPPQSPDHKSYFPSVALSWAEEGRFDLAEMIANKIGDMNERAIVLRVIKTRQSATDEIKRVEPDIFRDARQVLQRLVNTGPVRRGRERASKLISTNAHNLFDRASRTYSVES